jgi:serine/threonine protein kinase
MARRLRHDHIVKFVGGFRQHSVSYLIFQWANGGNLREFWNDMVNWPRSRDLILWNIKQMHGLAGALDEWHRYLPATQMNCRHGDLKPENIIKSGPSEQGIFQIADLGLAKVHSLPTHMRNKPSLSTSGTCRYRSPEIRIGGIQKISRSYDMWSMGCIFLEWIIWLLYGLDELLRFYGEAFPKENDGFFDPRDDSSPIQPNVRRWMDHIESTLLNGGDDCHSDALRQLFLFIKGGLLIKDSDFDTSEQNKRILEASNDQNPRPEINLIPDEFPDGTATNATAIGRAKSKDLRDELQKIVSHSAPDYIYHPRLLQGRRTSKGPPPVDNLAVQRNIWKPTVKVVRQQPEGQANTKNPYATPSSLDVWNTQSDIIYAKTVFSNLDMGDLLELSPKHTVQSSFCKDCSSADRGIFSRGSFSKSFMEAQRTRYTCNLCAILYEEMVKMPEKSSERMLLREESALTTARGDPPILSIVVGPTEGMFSTSLAKRQY